MDGNERTWTMIPALGYARRRRVQCERAVNYGGDL
jgi:hypothetical protein